MQFEVATPSRILFGAGTAAKVPEAAGTFGRHVLVVTGRSPDRSAWLVKACEDRRLAAAGWAVDGEPTLDSVRAGVERALSTGCDAVIAIGGGSVLDSGKAIAALLSNGGDPLDYLEVIGAGQPLRRAAVPLIAVPTTAGTGAEVTRNAVLASPAHGVKASLRSPFLLPAMAVVDPDLTRSLPPALTAATGLDALTQLIEPFVSPAATPLSDGFCREGLLRARALPRAYHDGNDGEAREFMAMASLFSGLALAHAKLGAVHGCAAVLGGRLSAPHGAICARLLPAVMAANVAALRDRALTAAALARYEEIGRALCGSPAAMIDDGIRWVEALVAELQVPGLGAHGLRAADIPAVVQEAQRASSTKGNPIPLNDAELTDVLRRAL